MNRTPLFLIAFTAAAGTLFAAEPPNFEEHVLPIFKEHCNGCHNPDKRKADLDLTTYAGLLKGSSGGEVVKAGVPDTSWLYESITHAEDAEPMPPKKPKIPDAQIEMIHKWIGGGLLEAKGGKSKLRNVSFDLAAGSLERPENPAMPTNLPKVPLAKTRVPPPVLALASSPWTNLIAASGHRQILLFGEQPASIETDDFEPVAEDALLMREDFEEEKNTLEGVVGKGWQADGNRQLKELPRDFLNQNGAFSFTA